MCKKETTKQILKAI